MMQRTLNLARRAWAICRTIARGKTRAADVLSQSPFPLRRGTWALGWHFSRHSSLAKLPPPLDLTKQWGGWGGGPVLRTLVRMMGVLLPPWQAKRTVGSNAPFESDVLLVNRLGQPIGFDLRRSVVVRLSTYDETDQLKEKYSHLAQIYNCVPFEIIEPGPYIVEPFIRGESFGRAPAASRQAVVRGFLDSLLAAPRQPPPVPAASHWEVMTDQLISEFELSPAASVAVRASLATLLTHAKYSWVHGDMFCENIIVRDGLATLIDYYETAQIGPCFTDIMKLFITEARANRPELLKSFGNGMLDDDFRSMGCPIGDPVDRLAIFVAWLGWIESRGTYSALNADKLGKLVRVARDNLPASAFDPPSLGVVEMRP